MLKVVLILWSVLAPLAYAQQAGAAGKDLAAARGAAAAATYALSTANKPWKGDFDGMLQRRMIRVDAPYSRSLYFVDKGKERGIGAELVRDFERWVNQKYVKRLGNRPITVHIAAPDWAGGYQ